MNEETCFIVSVAGEIPRIHPVIYTGLCVKVVDLAHTGSLSDFMMLSSADVR